MATARQFTVTDEQLASAGGGGAAYAALEVPGDYTALLVAVEDYDKTADGGGTGWIFNFQVEGLGFKVWVPFSTDARWKLIDTVKAFDPDFFEQRDADGNTPPVVPDKYIGQTVGAHIDFEKNKETKERDPNGRKVITYLFQYVEEASDVPIL